MSSAIVTGAYSMVASALDYWISLNQANGVTSDAYLTTPVGVNTLNFGPHAIKDLSAYNNPDGINGILAYTAVPAADVNDGGSLSTPPLVGTDGRTASLHGNDQPAVLRPGLDQQRHRLDRGNDRHQLPAQSQRLPADRHQRRRDHHGPGDPELHRHGRVEGPGRGRCHGPTPGRYGDLRAA